MASAHQFVVLPLLVAALALVVSLNGVSAIRVQQKLDSPVGLRIPIKDLKDAHVQDLAHFAVYKHNKETKEGLVFDTLYKGEKQISFFSTGIKYSLYITVKDKEAKKVNYKTTVLSKGEGKHSYKELLEFHKVE